MNKFFKKLTFPHFFKTKKFFIFIFVFILFFLFTPISLHQIGQRLENFINKKAKTGVQTFERQTGLKIEWGTLNFNIWTMTVRLENVSVLPLNTANFKKIQELNFLDGLQRFKKISARPSLYSLLFEKQIVLSHLKIEKGDIYLKTLKTFAQKKTKAQNIALPIKKLLIKDTHLQLSHKNHKLNFSKVRSKIRQTTKGIFHLDLLVKAFYISENLGFKEFYTVQPHKLNKKESYQLAFKGAVRKGEVSFQEINLKNKIFESKTHLLNIYFDSQGLTKLSIQSSGALPFVLINQGMSLMGQKELFISSLLSYKLNMEYKKNKGYSGSFEAQGQEALFRSAHLKSFFLKGRLRNYLITIDKGLIETQDQGDIYLKKGELTFKNKPLQFNFSAQTEKLFSHFVTQTILNLGPFPVTGDFTGSIHCRGAGLVNYLKCELEGKSEKVILQPKDQDEIMSAYGLQFNSNIEWDKTLLNFKVSGKKGDSSLFDLKGQYAQSLDQFTADYSFFGHLFKDLKFNTPFPLKGRLNAPTGKIIIKKNKLKLTGALNSPLLKLQSYNLNNISALYKMEDHKLSFFNIRGQPGRTNYSADCHIDFNQKNVDLKLESSFFDIENLEEALKDQLSLPVQFKGTGTVSFSIKLPWEHLKKHSFQFKGDFFNVSIGSDLFQQASFDFNLENEKGVVHSLSLTKGQGSIKGKGSFNSNYFLNLELAGQNLSLERLEWLNKILDLNQSGDVNFNMKITGKISDPKVTSEVFISNMFFYSYPTPNSRLKLNIDKRALSFSGQIMKEIDIDQFIYPFSKNSETKIKGQFTNLDLVKVFFSKNRIEKKQDYFSQITGSFSGTKTMQRAWSGSAKIDKLFVSKSDKWIKNEQPFSVFFDQNKWSLTPVEFSQDHNKRLTIEKKENNKLLLSGDSSLGLFSVFLPFLKEFEGDITGQILIDDNLKKPGARGSLYIKKSLLAFNVLPEFTNISADLILAKNNIFISHFKSLAGGGSVKGEGTIFYDFVNPPNLNLNLDWTQAYLNTPEDFNTKGSGKIKITGVKPPYLIDGEYYIDSGSITKDFSAGNKKTKYDFSLLKTTQKEQKSLFELKLNIKTQRAMDLNSSLIRSSVEGQADIYGPLNSLLINGHFNLSQKAEENLIFFRGQEFKISSGSVIFNHSPPDNPYLNIKASTLLTEQIVDLLESQQEIERKYKIFLSVKGLAQNPRFSLESSPPLNEKEIISLLTLGVDSRHFDTKVKESVTDYSYQILASLLLEKHLNKEIKNTLGVDFRLTPYINTLNKPVTKITFSKNWFEKWKSSFSRTIEDAQSDIRLKYNLNQKVSLTAFWENAGQTKLEGKEEDWLGLDFEFNFDF